MEEEEEKKKKSPYDLTVSQDDESIDNTTFASAMTDVLKRRNEYNELYDEGETPFSYDEFDNKAKYEVPGSIERAQRFSSYLSPENSQERENYRKRHAIRTLVPNDTPQRRRSLFATSPETIDFYSRNFFNEEMKPLLDEERKKVEDAARAELYKFARNADIASSPFEGMGMAQRISDPAKVADNVLKRINMDKLNELAISLANYGGYDVEDYRDKVLIPALRQQIANDYVSLGTPKNWQENLIRETTRNSLAGKIGEIGLNNFSGTNTWSELQDAQRANYNPNRLENFAAGTLSLMADMPAFGGYQALARPAVAGASKLLTRNLVKNFMAKGATREVAQQMAQKVITQNLASNIVKVGIGQGLTLGGYDATQAIVDQVMFGEGMDLGEVGKAFGKGLGTGMALGAVGTPISFASKNLRGVSRTMAKTGNLASQAGVFTLVEQADKLANGADIEPIDILYDFGSSAGTLLAMRGSHWLTRGANRKVNAQNELIPELKFSDSELEELSEKGINGKGLETVMIQLLSSPQQSTPKVESKRNTISRMYEEIMNDNQISATLKAKLMYLVEDKLTSTPPIPIRYKKNYDEEGNVTRVITVDYKGRPIERIKINSPLQYENFLADNEFQIDQNRVLVNEAFIQRYLEKQIFFKSAEYVGSEMGLSEYEVSEILYKIANDETLNGFEEVALTHLRNKAMKSGYGSDLVTELRRQTEVHFGMKRGDLKKSFEKPYDKRTGTELEAFYNYCRRLDERMAAYRVDNNMMGSEIDNFVPLEEETQFSKKGKKFADNNERYLKWKGLYEREAKLLGDALNTRVNMIENDTDIDSDNRLYRAERKNSKGWYDPETDEITIVMSNIENVLDLQQTILHEVVGHRGLRNMFGENFGSFLKDVYNNGDSRTVRSIDHIQMSGEYTLQGATEEYLSRLAEKSSLNEQETGVMEKFRNFVSKSLRKMGIPLKNKLTDNDLRDMLWKSRSALSMSDDALVRERTLQAQGSLLEPVKPQFRFLGKTGMRNLQKKGNALGTGSMEKLEQAKRMENEGAQPLDIKQKTGWERGADKQWRFEIDDSNFKFYFEPMQKLRDNLEDFMYYWSVFENPNPDPLRFHKEARLGKIMDEYGVFDNVWNMKHLISDNIWFDAYPNLKKMGVEMESMPKNVYSRYDRKRNIMYINQDLADDIRNFDQNRRAIGYTEADRNLDMELLRNSLLRNLQRAVQFEENFSRNQSLEGVLPRMGRLYKKIAEEAKEAQASEYDGRYSSKKSHEQRVAEFVEKYKFSPEDFLRLYPSANDFILRELMQRRATQAGEVEVNNVVKRKNMTPAERAASLALETEGVPRNEQLYYGVDAYREMERRISESLKKRYPEAYDEGIVYGPYEEK